MNRVTATSSFVCALLLSLSAQAAQPLDEEALESIHIAGGNVLNVMGASAASDVSQQQEPGTTGESNTLGNTRQAVSSSDDSRQNPGWIHPDEPDAAGFRTNPDLTPADTSSLEVSAAMRTNTKGEQGLSLNITGRVDQVDVHRTMDMPGGRGGDFSFRGLDTINNVMIIPRN